MSGLADLLSTIVFFLAWLFPVLIIIATRRRVQDQKKKKADSVEKKPLADKEPSRKPMRFPGRPDELVNRLMDIQGIRQVNSEPVKEPEPEVKPAAKYHEVPIKNKRTSPAAVTSVVPKRQAPLAVTEKYSLNKRAIVLAALIGKPKALDTRP